MARPLLRLLSALLAGFALGPASAGAVDRVVDDDKVQCPGAAFTDVQSAVDAAQYGDVVRVCRGTYAGQVVVPHTKANLKLVSAPAGAATLTAPPGGLELTGGHPLAILVSYGRGIYIHGFTVRGPLGTLDETHCNSHLHASGIAVPRGRTTIDGVRILDPVVDCRVLAPHCSPFDRCFEAVFGAGVHTGDVDGGFASGPFGGESGVVVDRSFVRGARNGVLVEGGAGAVTVQRSILAGPSDPDENPFLSAGVVIFDVEGGTPSTLLLKVQSNEITGWGVGVWDRFHVEGLVLVNGNRVDNSVFGIAIDSGFNRVERNRVTGGAFGISQGASSFDFSYADVRENVVRDVEEIGIGVFSNVCRDLPCRSLVRDNSALGSGEVDCFDPDRSARWTRNTGATAVPADLCRAPQGTVSTLRRGAVQAARNADRLGRRREQLEHHHGVSP